MKIVNRLDFMKLPSGTLYRKFVAPFVFDDLAVKFDSLPHGEDGDGDFICMELGDVDASSSEQMFDRLDEMMERGASYPINLDCAGRDGCFESEALFLVYERDDVMKLHAFIGSLLPTEKVSD